MNEARAKEILEELGWKGTDKPEGGDGVKLPFFPLMNKMNVGVELLVEGELIYLAASEDKEEKYDITPDAYAAVFHSMAAHAERLGGNCAIAFPGGVLQFKKRDRGTD